MKVSYRKKRWNALIDFRDYLTRTKAEIVKQFNGHELVTDKGSYGLVASELIFHPLEKKKKTKNKL